MVLALRRFGAAPAALVGKSNQNHCSHDPVLPLVGYAAMLEKAGYEVLTASTGEMALDLYDEEMDKISMVLLDLIMPGLDGYQVLLQMKADPELKEIPVIMSTAYGEYRNDFNVWASDAYVVKTANLTQLKETIKRLLEEGN